MKVDVEKAKKHLGEQPLTKQQIIMLKKILNNKMSTWFVEKQLGEKLSNEDKKNLLKYLDEYMKEAK